MACEFTGLSDSRGGLDVPGAMRVPIGIDPNRAKILTVMASDRKNAKKAVKGGAMSIY